MPSKRRVRPAPAESRAAVSARRWRIARLELGLVLLALLVRLPHLGWGLPEVEEEALPMKQALAMWGWNRGHVTLDPGVAGWPSLSFYLNLALQHLQYWIGRLSGAFASRDDFFVSHWFDNGPVVLVARAASALATVGIVWCAARLARRLAGTEAAILVAGLLVLSPMLIAYAQLVTPDVWVALFSALAVARIVAIQQRGATADYVWAGIWIGLGVSSKYTPVLLLPALFAAHALRSAAASGAAEPLAGRKLRTFVARAPWLGVLAAVLVFALTSPYVLFDVPVLLRDLRSQAIHMTEGHFGGATRPPAIEYAIGVLPQALGWVGLALSLVGLAWACVRFGGPWLAIAACIVPYYLGLSLLKTQFPRYVLPLLMPLAMGLAGLVASLREIAAVRARVRIAAALLAVAVLAPLAVAAWRYHAEQGRPSAVHLANQMFLDDPPLRRAHIASEVLGLSLPTARALDGIPAGLLQRLTREQKRRLYAKPAFDVDFIPMYTVQPEMSAFYYDVRHYSDYDFIVISQSIRDRYLADTLKFATQAAFYHDLDRYGTLIQSYGAKEHARPPEIFIYQVSPESSAVLRRQRGPVAFDPQRLRPLVNSDFMVFVEGVARTAYAHNDWAMAARYYRLLWAAGPQAGMAPAQRDALGRMVTQLESRAGAPPTSR